MIVRYCTICSTSFDAETDGSEGEIGLIPVAFCATCRAGIYEYASQEWDLVPREEE